MIDASYHVDSIVSQHSLSESELQSALLAAVTKSNEYGYRYSVNSSLDNIVRSRYVHVSPMISRVANEASSQAMQLVLSVSSLDSTFEEAALLESFSDSFAKYMNNVLLSVLNHVAALSKRQYQQFWLRVNASMSRDNFSREQAMSVEQSRLMNETFSRMDRRGRNWKANRYLEVEIKNAVTTLHNDIVVNMLTTRGFKQAEIYQPDNEDKHEKVFDLIDYEEMKAKYFHPNSLALVRPIRY